MKLIRLSAGINHRMSKHFYKGSDISQYININIVFIITKKKSGNSNMETRISINKLCRRKLIVILSIDIKCHLKANSANIVIDLLFFLVADN